MIINQLSLRAVLKEEDSTSVTQSKTINNFSKLCNHCAWADLEQTLDLKNGRKPKENLMQLKSTPSH